MDSKWNAFVADDTLFLHRSWTGNGIYELTFVAAGGGRRVGSGMVESDPERYKPSTAEFDCVMAELVISNIILGEDTPELRRRFAEVVQQRSGRADLPEDAIRHSALGIRIAREHDQ